MTRVSRSMRSRRGARPHNRRASVHHLQSLGHRNRLTRKQRFVYFEPIRNQHLGIGRNAIARFQHDQVSRDDVLRIYQHPFIIPEHARAYAEQMLQGLAAFLRLPFLDTTDQSVEYDDDTNESGVPGMVNHNRYDCSCDQYIDERTSKLTQSHLPPGRWWLFGKHIWPMTLEQRTRFPV